MTGEQHDALKAKLTTGNLDGWEMAVVIACINMAASTCFEQFEKENGRMMSSHLATMMHKLTHNGGALDNASVANPRRQRTDYDFKSRYSTASLLKDGGVMSGGVMHTHLPIENGSGGVIFEFARKGNRWRLSGLGRANHAHVSDEVKRAFNINPCHAPT